MATKEEILSTFKSEEGAWFAYREGVQTGYNGAYNSLRNQAAIAALQGLSANPNLVYDNSEEKINIIARAMKYADALIEQLKKEKK